MAFSATHEAKFTRILAFVAFSSLFVGDASILPRFDRAKIRRRRQAMLVGRLIGSLRAYAWLARLLRARNTAR